jgi:hypothetical protein
VVNVLVNVLVNILFNVLVNVLLNVIGYHNHTTHLLKLKRDWILLFLHENLKQRAVIERRMQSATNREIFVIIIAQPRGYCNAILQIQYNPIQYNTIQYNTIHYNTIQSNTIQSNTIQYNPIQYNTIQYTTIQSNTIQSNTIQYNTIQYNTIQYFVGCLHVTSVITLT